MRCMNDGTVELDDVDVDVDVVRCCRVVCVPRSATYYTGTLPGKYDMCMRCGSDD
jgi:hypothetical protein